MWAEAKGPAPSVAVVPSACVVLWWRWAPAAVGRSSEAPFAMALAVLRVPPRMFATDESADVAVCRWHKWTHGLFFKALGFGCTRERIPDTYGPSACPGLEEL